MKGISLFPSGITKSFLKNLMMNIQNTPTGLQSKPAGKLSSYGYGQMHFIVTGNANGKIYYQFDRYVEFDVKL